MIKEISMVRREHILHWESAKSFFEMRMDWGKKALY